VIPETFWSYHVVPWFWLSGSWSGNCSVFAVSWQYRFSWGISCSWTIGRTHFVIVLIIWFTKFIYVRNAKLSLNWKKSLRVRCKAGVGNLWHWRAALNVQLHNAGRYRGKYYPSLERHKDYEVIHIHVYSCVYTVFTVGVNTFRHRRNWWGRGKWEQVPSNIFST